MVLRFLPVLPPCPADPFNSRQQLDAMRLRIDHGYERLSKPYIG